MPRSTRTPGRTVLVTGASSGIGEATVRQLVDVGWTVYAGARRVERMRELERMGARVLPLDVTREESVESAVTAIESEAGGIDALVNNAAYGEYGALEDVPDERARYQLEVNLLGPARLIRHVLPGMRAKRAGRIVNVSSFGGRVALPLGAWYHASKFALEGLSDSLRREVAAFGVDVVVVQPGSTHTEWPGITYDNLVAASASGPYAELTESSRRLGMSPFQPGGVACEPDVVARVVVKALRARRPRTRYAVPLHSRAFVFLPRVLGDRTMDFLIRLQLRWPFLVRPVLGGGTKREEPREAGS